MKSTRRIMPNNYITEHANSNYIRLLGTAEVMQTSGSHGYEADVTLSDLELSYRIIVSLLEHTEGTLADHVYDYNYNNIKCS